jgi:hypothetical protein
MVSAPGLSLRIQQAVAAIVQVVTMDCGRTHKFSSVSSHAEHFARVGEDSWCPSERRGEQGEIRGERH